MSPTQTFHDHVRELRLRLVYVFIALGITGTLGYLARNPLIRFIQKPLHETLYYTSPAGSFNFVIKIATSVGVFLALPVIVYNIIKFIEPALPKKISSRHLFKVTAGSFILALVGMGFGYIIIVPMSLHFFSSYSSAGVKPLITANEYLSFILSVLITFALMFQIPLIVLFINFIKPLNPRNLLHYQRYIIIASLIIAVLLPFTYDPISQFVLALPIIFLFYVSLVLVKIVNGRKQRASRLVNIEPEPVYTPPLPAAVIEPVRATSVPKPKPRLYLDGFIKTRPSNTALVGQKAAAGISIEEYRARYTLPRKKHGYMSIDGFTFAR